MARRIFLAVANGADQDTVAALLALRLRPVVSHGGFRPCKGPRRVFTGSRFSSFTTDDGAML
jgi:hypothetical protein